MSPADEAARTGALLVPRSDLATFAVSGPDRLAWLQGVLTCDVAGLRVGDGRFGLILSRQGKMLSDVLVVAGDDVVYLGVPANVAERVFAWLFGFLVMEDADLENETERHAWFGVHGPRGTEVARALSSRTGGIVGTVDPTGLGGAVFVVPVGLRAEVLAAASEAGAVVATGDDFRRLRVERQLPQYGEDVGEQQNPHEASLDRRAVSWEKGCYLGQEAVCMLEMRGKVKRRLALLSLPGDGAAPPAGTPVLDAAGAVVGETRSAVESAVWGGAVALALLQAAASAPGTPLRVSGRAAQVVEPNR